MDRFETFIVTHDDSDADEVALNAALHLEAWTDETHADLFARACRVLRDNGIRVKMAWSPDATTHPDEAQALADIIYPPRDSCGA